MLSCCTIRNLIQTNTCMLCVSTIIRRTIISLSVIYAIGNIIVSVSAIPIKGAIGANM